MKLFFQKTWPPNLTAQLRTVDGNASPLTMFLHQNRYRNALLRHVYRIVYSALLASLNNRTLADMRHRLSMDALDCYYQGSINGVSGVHVTLTLCPNRIRQIFEV